jgi:predicted O-methyltransferase YrrM
VPELYETKALQHNAEIDRFVELVKRENVRSYLEIGSKFGGSLWRVGSVMPAGSKIVAVDMPHGTRAWNDSRRSLEACVSHLNRIGQRTTLLWGDSTDEKIVSSVRALAPFDLVLIDGDHNLPFVTKDWENYGPLGRIVAFHDIAWKRAPGASNYQIDVPKFWESIKGMYPHREEIVLDPTGQDNGFGVLWRPQC